jgi:predicted dehydrogenase
MATDVQWGVLGNATIARKCVIGAIQRSRNGRLRALASRSPEEARKIVRRHDIPVLYERL